MAALYTGNIQKPARCPEYRFGEVTRPNASRLNEAMFYMTLALYISMANCHINFKIILFFYSANSRMSNRCAVQEIY